MTNDMNPDLWLPDSDLDADQRSFALEVRAFAEASLAPHAREIDEQRKFRREAVTDLATAVILGGPLPEELGGSGPAGGVESCGVVGCGPIPHHRNTF